MEIMDRPAVGIIAPKDGKASTVKLTLSRVNAWADDDDAIADEFDAYAAAHVWAGERMPEIRAGFGPDQFAGFLGGDLVLEEETGNTSWTTPYVSDWDQVLSFRLEPANRWWNGILRLTSALRERGRGKFLVSMIDLHSHADALCAMRGAQDLLFDMIDRPDAVDRAMASARTFYQPIYNGVFTAGGMAETGASLGSFYGAGRTGFAQCDMICNIGPDMFRRFILPAIEEEASFLDHCAFHVDGEGALTHLDDLLAIESLDVISWVAGAGNKPMVEWTDLLRRIQAAGKGVHLHSVSPEEAKRLHKLLKPEGVYYDLSCDSEKEANDLLAWFVKHT